MITTENITLGFGQKNLFENVNIIFNPGFKYGIIGANGAGKSTFLKILAGEIQQDRGTVSMPPKSRLGVLRQDHYRFDDYSVLDAVYQGHKELWALMQERNRLYAKSEMTEEEGNRVGEIENEFMEMDGYSSEAKASALLTGLGVPESYHHTLMKETPTNFKFRALLAQVLFGEPDIMLLDEPTNNLDIKSIAWLEEFLNEYEGTLAVVSHDRTFLNNVCTHIADIDFGRLIVYAGDYDYYQAAAAITRDNKLTAEARRTKRAAELKSFIQRFGANKSKARQATSRKKQLEQLLEVEEVRPSSRVYPSIIFPMERELGKDVVRLEGVFKGYDGGEPVIKNFNLQYQKGEKVAVIGPNGVGKTTFMKLLAQELTPDKGEIHWGATTKRGYCPQDIKAYLPKGITLFNYLFNVKQNLDQTTVRGLLGRMLFKGEDGDKKIDVLSGGETVRMILARIMLEEPNVLILDEPTNNLDLESIESLSTGISQFKGAAFFVSHDRKFIQSLATRILEIYPNGEVLDYRGNYDEYVEFLAKNPKRG